MEQTMTSASTHSKVAATRLFDRIQAAKGQVAPIAEKAHRNLAVKSSSTPERIHHFIVGHAFKQMDTAQVFALQFTVNENKLEAKCFQSLLKESFTNVFVSELKELIKSIRDINSHCIHDFHGIRTENIDPALLRFLRESFEVAALHTFMREPAPGTHEPRYKSFNETDSDSPGFVNFLVDKFYPAPKQPKNYETPDEASRRKMREHSRADEKLKSRAEVIQSILFIRVHEPLARPTLEQPIFEIEPGEYLSYEACLFLLSLLLYRSEVNQLIARMKGFKRNGTPEEKSKREIYSFFAKKFSSQDINSEEAPLIRFRDLVEYLNHYPTVWNKELELVGQAGTVSNPVKDLCASVIDLEIKRRYANYTDNERFQAFARFQLFGAILGDAAMRDYNQCAFSREEQNAFSDEINCNPAILNARKEIGDLKRRLAKPNLSSGERKDIEKKKGDAKRRIKRIVADGQEGNRNTEKLKARIANNTFFMGYGRNQDRFMDFAARYLAEMKYFGVDACFKMYRFYTTDEQNDFLATLDQKQRDKLTYHEGRLIHWGSYQEHLKDYPYWDMPFVEQNNAVYIEVPLRDGLRRRICIQRNLMYYLLQHALISAEEGNGCAGAGKALLGRYHQAHAEDLLLAKSAISRNDDSNRTLQSKLLPSRYVQRFRPQEEQQSSKSTLRNILTSANEAEERYALLYRQAEQVGRLDDFLKRNKGKQFKLRFVRKAWQRMYFRPAYDEQVARHGHHKAFNITKEEFNDFCRWMFAFDVVPEYKKPLMELLRRKKFLDIPAFAMLLNKSGSLDDLYQKTKAIYSNWLSSAPPKPQPEPVEWKRYEDIMEHASSIWHINISHFKEWLEHNAQWPRRDGGLDFVYVTRHRDKLNAAYYYRDSCKGESKEVKKLFRELNTCRLEDALLYELALRYLRIAPDIVQRAAVHVSKLLKQNVEFDIKKKANGALVYHLTVPFKKIDAYVELRQNQKEQEAKHKDSFLERIPTYMHTAGLSYGKELKELSDSLGANPPRLSFDQLHKFESHIIAASTQFTDVCMAFERYFGVKEWQRTPGIFKGNRINAGDIPFLKQDIDIRDRAFHFGTPYSAYIKKLKAMEQAFIRSEITAGNWEELPAEQKKICEKLLRRLHNNLYVHRKEDNETQKHKNAEMGYFEKVVLQARP